jgi:hypothetical protein
MIGCNAGDAMDSQLLLLAMKDYLTQMQIGKFTLFYSNDVAGPNRGQHAGASDSQASSAGDLN